MVVGWGLLMRWSGILRSSVFVILGLRVLGLLRLRWRLLRSLIVRGLRRRRRLLVLGRCSRCWSGCVSLRLLMSAGMV